MPLADEILEFWFGPVFNDERKIPGERLKFWFGGAADTDRLITQRFSTRLDAVSSDSDGLLRPATAHERLARILLLDQFPRNIHRGLERAFAYDGLALQLALDGLELRQDQDLPLVGRAFFYLPLEHAEDLALQEQSVALFAALRDAAGPLQRAVFESFYDYAVRHRDIIARFGRFPHRNRMLGRESSAEERAFLKRPGSSF